ncbi:MAG: helix-turn-helix domain-containing protein [Bacteroidota bacterium]
MEVRSHCPTNFALEHFGDKWSLLIIRDLMFKGKRHYNEFLQAEEQVSTSVLGNRLRSLQDAGLITRSADTVKKSRIRYSLTMKGIDLLPLMVDMIVWSGQYDAATAAPAAFLEEATQNRDAMLHTLRAALITSHIVS